MTSRSITPARTYLVALIAVSGLLVLTLYRYSSLSAEHDATLRLLQPIRDAQLSADVLLKQQRDLLDKQSSALAVCTSALRSCLNEPTHVPPD